MGERCEGPIFIGADGLRLDRHSAGRIVRRVARKAGIVKRGGPHTLRHASSAPRSTPASRYVMSKSGQSRGSTEHHALRPRRVSLDRHATYIVATFLAGAAR